MDGQQAQEKCSILLIIREMQIKITIRYHLTLVRMAITKKYGEGVGKKVHSYTVGGSVNWCSH